MDVCFGFMQFMGKFEVITMKEKNNHLKLITAIFLISMSNGFAQTKNEQIEILQKQVDSLLVVNKKLYNESEIGKQNNAQLVGTNNELRKSCTNLDSLLKISKNLTNASNSQFKLLSNEIKKVVNPIESIDNIIELQHPFNFTKMIYSQNNRDFYTNEKPEWDYEYIEYRFYFTSDSILYKVELSPIPIRYTLFSTIFLDYFGNVVAIKHSTSDVGRTDTYTNLYFDEFHYYFFNKTQKVEHKSRILESSWEENITKNCEELILCTNEDHSSENENENSCDKTEISIRNRIYTNKTILIELLEKAN